MAAVVGIAMWDGVRHNRQGDGGGTTASDGGDSEGGDCGGGADGGCD